MKALKRTFIFILTILLLVVSAAAFPKTAFAANASYDISEVASVVGSHKTYEMKVGAKETGEKKLDYGDSVKFAYKERSDKNQYGHYSRTAFGIGSYGFYFYHSAGDIDVRICNLESDAKNWERAASGFATIPDNAFKEFTEVAVKAEIKQDDESAVVFSLTYGDKTISKEFSKNENSDMKFRFGDHDVDGNLVKSLAPKTDNEPPVITVAVSEFKVPAGAYPADDAFYVTDNSGEYKVTLSWSLGALDEFGRLTVGTHVCTIIATDYEENSSSATITYIVTDDKALKEYKLNFIADGKLVKTITYTEESAEFIVPPEVPEKEYYEGEWEKFTPEMNDTQTVEAKYTAKKYLVVFVADKKIISEQYYTIEDKNIKEPEVPKKEGYTGKWETYELNFKNVRVSAVYTKNEPDNPDNPDTPGIPDNPDTPKPDNGGCNGSVSGAPIVMLAVAAFAIAVCLKRKRG